MKTIDLKTSQKVVVTYELAGFRNRFFAYTIDFIAIWLLVGLVSMAFSVAEVEPDYAIYGILFLYTLVSELLMGGQTLGKKALGIKVMHLAGREANFTETFTRWALRSMDIYGSLGAIATLLIVGTDRQQRLGDSMSGTIVINLRPSQKVDLARILRLQERFGGEIKYPQASRYKESEILLFKKVLERSKRQPGTASSNALSRLCTAIAKDLDLPSAQVSDNKRFLEELISSYVSLTR